MSTNQKKQQSEKQEQAQRDGEALDLDRQGIKDAPQSLKETHAPRSPDIDEPDDERGPTVYTGDEQHLRDISKAVERLRKVADTQDTVASSDIQTFITRVENALRQVN